MTGLGLALTEDQRAFGATVERYFAERYDAELGWREGASAQVWAALADLGVPAAGLPAMGGGPAEIAVAMIAAGRSLAVEPLLATAVLGAAVLRYASGPLADTLLSGVAEGTVQIATAYEEPGGRLDPAVVAATARAQGDDWARRRENLRAQRAASQPPTGHRKRSGWHLALCHRARDAGRHAPLIPDARRAGRR